MAAEYRFRYSEDYLLTSLIRYRQQVWWRWPFYSFKWILAVLLAGPFVFFIVKGLVIPAGIFGAILGALLLGWPIDAWIARKNLRKSPLHNDEIVFSLSEEGSRMVGREHDVRVGWTLYTKARRFKDGLLLFQGPHFVNWLPDVSASDPSGVAVAQELARSHIRDYRDV
jgi:hypothetical protein